jgi:hypothetical protein
VEFSTTETSVTTGGVLTAARSDFDSSGAPLEGSNAFKLATMKTELPKASRLILGQEPTKATIEWIGSQKVATIPADFGLALSLFNEILANNKPESVSKIEVADIDSLKSDTAVLSYKDGERGVVRVRKNPAMLTMLAGKIGGMSADDNEQRKWKLTDKLEQAPVNPVKLS